MCLCLCLCLCLCNVCVVGLSDLDNESEPLTKRIESIKDSMISVTSGAFSIFAVLYAKLRFMIFLYNFDSCILLWRKMNCKS
jgi:hypothetical protein